ncbi:MAG: hypothetical protein U0M60_10880, partial [Clostridia bacterium]|nr:hypothetical protein [Clostridia bacterium]
MKSNKRHSLSFRSIALLLAIISLCLVIFAGCTEKPLTDEVVIGIAWREDTDSEFYTNIVNAVKEAGGKPVLLEQVKADYLTYDSENTLLGCSDEVGGLTLETANVIKENLWENTNVEDVMQGIDAVIFTGGEDISSSL